MDRIDPHLLYPCSFPIKVIGDGNRELEMTVIKVFASHKITILEKDIERTRSRNGKYISLTIHIIARSREFLDQLYRELEEQENVRIVL